MSLVLQPNGLLPQGYNQEGSYEGGFSTYQLTTNNTVAIARGDLVGLVAGSIVPLTANPTPGTLSANSILGVAMGFNYIAPAGQPAPFHNSQILPANAVTAGYTNISVMVVSVSGRNFEVQANGVVTFAQIGSGINMNGWGAASQPFKQSGIYADVSTLNQTSGNTTAWKIYQIAHDQDNVNTNNAGYIQAIANDVYTKIVVQAAGTATLFGLLGAQ